MRLRAELPNPAAVLTERIRFEIATRLVVSVLNRLLLSGSTACMTAKRGKPNSPDLPPFHHVKISREQQGRVRQDHNAPACRRGFRRESLSQQARAAFAEATRSIDLGRAVQQHLHCNATTLILGEANVPLRELDQILVLAIGKAAVPMYHAADTALALLRRVTPRTAVLFLLSGGASAMIERPLDPHIALPDIAAFHR